MRLGQRRGIQHCRRSSTCSGASFTKRGFFRASSIDSPMPAAFIVGWSASERRILFATLLARRSHAATNGTCMPAFNRWSIFHMLGFMTTHMQTIDIHDAKTHLFRLVDRAARGESFVIAKAGKPLAKVVPLHTFDAGQVKRIGFLEGQIFVPDDFDRLGRADIEQLLG